MASNSNQRSVNWVEQISRSLAATFPSFGVRNSEYLTVRLSQRLLERLPPDVANALLELLPEAVGGDDSDSVCLRRSAAQQPELSIGYPDLVELAQRSLIEPLSILEDEFFERVVDYFLWEFAQQLSPDLKYRISENLPVDLRTRMNLYSGHVEESKVA